MDICNMKAKSSTVFEISRTQKDMDGRSVGRVDGAHFNVPIFNLAGGTGGQKVEVALEGGMKSE